MNGTATQAPTGALRGLRKHKSAKNLLRTPLIHLRCVHPLPETIVRAHQARLAHLSDVALPKRLCKSRQWLQALWVELFQLLGVALVADRGLQARAFVGRTTQEPGRIGPPMRRHYIQLPVHVRRKWI